MLNASVPTRVFYCALAQLADDEVTNGRPFLTDYCFRCFAPEHCGALTLCIALNLAGRLARGSGHDPGASGVRNVTRVGRDQLTVRRNTKRIERSAGAMSYNRQCRRLLSSRWEDKD